MISDPQASEALIKQTKMVRPHLKTFVPFNRCWHDMLHELESEQVIQRAIDWVDDRLRAAFLATTLD